MNIIPLTSDYLSDLARLNHQLLEDEGNTKSLSTEYLYQRMKNWLENKQFFGFGGLNDDGQLVAYLLACYESESIVYVRQLITERNYRRQGYASTLLKHLEKYLGADQQIKLDVLMHNKNAIYFYASQGYKPFYMAMVKTT
ncbi:GNAT family N-acetyltransferase [Celerinatantimonas sp. YJH-8]|uniref:GNAT family N-acetyltransferase n=1 Tax=Celerinatantimonas sp. YJH-8 TaxID=3228714 RepID=UPI0038C04D4C